MTSANLPINLETTPLFKDYVSNVKKQLVKTKQNSESKRQGTRLQVARKSTSWHRSLKIVSTSIESTAASPTPVISETTINSTSVLSPICEGENGTENELNEKNGEKERARSDGTNSPVEDHHDLQATSNSPLLNQHSPKDIEYSVKIEKEEQTQNEDSSSSINQHFSQHTSSNKKFHDNHEYNHLHENRKEDPDLEKKEEKEKDLSKQSSKDTSDSMETATLSTPESIETIDSTTSVPLEGVVAIKQQKEQEKKSEEKEEFKRKLSYDNTEHVSREKTIRNCSPPPESYKEEDKPC